MTLERSKTDAVLDIKSGSSRIITFMKEFVKPGVSNGFPRLSNNGNLVEISPDGSRRNVESTDRPRSNVATSTGLCLTRSEITEATSTMPAGSKGLGAAPNNILPKRSRAMVSFHCSPFDTCAVRVATSAPVEPPLTRETSLINNTPYGWTPPVVAALPEIPHYQNPTHPLPPVPQQQYTQWETTEGHWRNEQRANTLRRLKHMNNNIMLAKMYYGTKEEVANYKNHMRSILKKQMDEEWKKSRSKFHINLAESEAAIEYDRECLREDMRVDRQKKFYLKQFAFDNLELANERQQRRTREKEKEKDLEQRLLKYNPINWSGTMT